MVENAEDTEAKLSVNMQKFKNEIDSVNRLLLAENDRLTEIHDNLFGQVENLRARIESKSKRLMVRNDEAGGHHGEERRASQGMGKDAAREGGQRRTTEAGVYRQEYDDWVKTDILI